jgi:glycosyltransferase involved in cell wall biosynthesis
MRSPLEPPLRVLYARNHVLPRDLGGNRYPFEVVRRLAARGHDVRVVSSSDLRLPGVGLTRYRGYSANPALTFGSHAALGRRAMRRLLRDWTPDIVVLSSYDIAFGYYWPYPVTRTVPSVFIYHSRFHSDAVNRMLDDRKPLRRAVSVPLRRFAAAVQRLPLERSDECVAVSEFSRREIAALAPAARVTVVSTGVDTEHFSPGDRDVARRALGVPVDARMLLTVGRLVPVKRYDRAIRALASLERESTADPWRLHIAGTGSEDAELRAVAAREGVAERVIFDGQLDGDALLLRYRAADLQLCTSDFENWSLSILEGLATGLPVLGTPAGGTPDLLRPIDTRLVARSLEPSDIAEGTRRILESADLEDLRRRCREGAERFSWDRVVSELEAVLRRVVRQASH